MHCPLATALRACGDLDAVGDGDLDALWATAAAQYGVAAKRAAIRALLLAEARGWLHSTTPPSVVEPPAQPLAVATRSRSDASRQSAASSAPAVRSPHALPDVVVAWVFRHLRTHDVIHAAAPVCRAFAAVGRDPASFSTVRVTAGRLADCGRRGWWWFVGRRPDTLRVDGVLLPRDVQAATSVLRRVWSSVRTLHVEHAPLVVALRPQALLRDVRSWPASHADLVRLVARPDRLRTLSLRKLSLCDRAHAAWWSRATTLTDLCVSTVDSAPLALQHFGGFPALQRLQVVGAGWTMPADAPVTDAAVLGMLRATRGDHVQVRLNCKLVTAPHTAAPRVALRLDSLSFSEPVQDPCVSLLCRLAHVDHLTVMHGEASQGNGGALVRVCATAAGRVGHDLVIEEVSQHVQPRTATAAELARLDRFRASLGEVTFYGRTTWVRDHAPTLAPCLRLGRQVNLRLVADVAVDNLVRTLAEAMPEFQWVEEVGHETWMATVGTLMGTE